MQEAIVLGAWLKPGAHLDLVGTFTVDMRETDDEVGATPQAALGLRAE